MIRKHVQNALQVLIQNLRKCFSTSCENPGHNYHLKQDNNPERFKCTSCEPRKRKSQPKLLKHIQQSKFTCDVCSFTSMHKSNLKRHMKKQHTKTDLEIQKHLIEAECRNKPKPNSVDSEAEDQMNLNHEEESGPHNSVDIYQEEMKNYKEVDFQFEL